MNLRELTATVYGTFQTDTKMNYPSKAFNGKKWGQYKRHFDVSYAYFAKIETLPLPVLDIPFTVKLRKQVKYNKDGFPTRRYLGA